VRPSSVKSLRDGANHSAARHWRASDFGICTALPCSVGGWRHEAARGRGAWPSRPLSAGGTRGQSQRRIGTISPAGIGAAQNAAQSAMSRLRLSNKSPRR
jgi:hypothetical protein